MDPTLGVIGGSGLYELPGLERVERVRLETPFGAPSDEFVVGHLGGVRLAFLPRHGRGHRLLPSELPFRANLYGLKTLGVQWVLAVSAVGSLREEIAPGHVVVPDQFIDRTCGRTRESTFFGGGVVAHVQFADPFCPALSTALGAAARASGATVHAGGTYVCMEGPQFSTRAESLMHRAWGADLIGMTALPEAKLAREAQMCYALVALASDYDSWRPHDSHVAQPPSARESKESPPRAGVPHISKQTLLQEILSNLHKATDNSLALICDLLAGDEQLVDETCPCRKSLELAVWTAPDYISLAERQRLAVLFE